KLYLIWTALGHRRTHPALYAQGAYRPLDVEGERKGNLVAFGRYREGHYALAVVPRLVAGMMGDDARDLPVGRDAWGDTRLLLPDVGVPRHWRDLLTDAVVEIRELDGRPGLPLAEVFRGLPVALLVGEGRLGD